MAGKSTERAIVTGARVRQAIQDAGINNSELARRTGLPRRTIVRVANGHNEPDSATLEKIATGTGKTLDYFAIDASVASPRVVEAVQQLYLALLDDVKLAIAVDSQKKISEPEKVTS